MRAAGQDCSLTQGIEDFSTHSKCSLWDISLVACNAPTIILNSACPAIRWAHHLLPHFPTPKSFESSSGHLHGLLCALESMGSNMASCFWNVADYNPRGELWKVLNTTFRENVRSFKKLFSEKYTFIEQIHSQCLPQGSLWTVIFCEGWWELPCEGA